MVGRLVKAVCERVMGQIRIKKRPEVGDDEVKEESVEGNGGNLYPETPRDSIEK